MVDYKEIKNAASLKSDDVSKDELEILSHQNPQAAIQIGQHNVATMDIYYQWDKTFAVPRPEGKAFSLNGFVSPEDVKENYLASFDEVKVKPETHGLVA